MNYTFKSLYFSFLAALLFFPSTNQAQRSPSFPGTYKYLLDDREGMCIASKTHLIWILYNKNRNTDNIERSDSTRAAAFSDATADVCSYKLIGPSRISVTRLYSIHPDLIGKGFTFEYEFDGNLCKYWILQSDGSRGPMGTATRIER